MRPITTDPRRSAALSLAAGLAAVALTGTAASAQTSVDAPFAGVRHYTRTATVPRPLTINVVEFDLAAPGLSFYVTPRTGTGNNESVGRTTTSAVNLYDANIGINGSFYRFFDANAPDADVEGNGTTALLNRGLVASNGDLYSPFERDRRPWPVFNISQDNVASVVSRVRPPDFPRPRPINADITPDITLYNAVSGTERIVTDGVNTAGDANLTFGAPETARSRTSIGRTADNRLLMVTVDEGSNASRGANLSEMAEIMRQYGAVDAINLDGGGSTTLAFRDDGGSARVVNALPGGQRAVATHVMARASAATEVVDTFVYADFLLGDTGGYNRSPTEASSGSTTGVLDSSTNTIVDTGELGRRGFVQELKIDDDPAEDGGWLVRHLSNGGSRSANTPRATTGFVGFYAMTETEGVKVALAIDDTQNVTADRGVMMDLIADGEYHLYQWNLEDDAQWEGFANGDGVIDTADFTIDSIQLFGPDAGAVIFLDDVTHNALGPIAAVPEPAGLCLAGLAGAGLLRRSRRATA